MHSTHSREGHAGDKYALTYTHAVNKYALKLTQYLHYSSKILDHPSQFFSKRLGYWDYLVVNNQQTIQVTNNSTAFQLLLLYPMLVYLQRYQTMMGNDQQSSEEDLPSPTRFNEDIEDNAALSA